MALFTNTSQAVLLFFLCNTITSSIYADSLPRNNSCASG